MNRHITIAVPAYRGIDPETVQTILGITISLAGMGVPISFATLPRMPIIECARAELVARFLEARHSTHLFFLDADVSFDPSVVLRMLDADADIVVAACIGRGGKQFTLHGLPGTAPAACVRRGANGERLLEVFATGIGCSLIKRHVFEKMAARFPDLTYTNPAGDLIPGLFHTDIRDVIGGATPTRRFVGEDFAYCIRAREAGFKVEVILDVTTTHDTWTGNYGEDFDRMCEKKPETGWDGWQLGPEWTPKPVAPPITLNRHQRRALAQQAKAG